MSGTPTLLYLEADDEITAVVRRVRAADPGRVVIVAPGRSRATSSVVALRLLARAGEDEGRELAIVGDALTRSLAAEAGLDAHASVEEARSATGEGATDAVAPRHAAIHVVRGPGSDETVAGVASAPPEVDTETRPVAVVRPPRPAIRARPRRRLAPLVAVLGTAGTILLIAVVAAANLLPAATIRITPRSDVVGPVPYRMVIGDPERTQGSVTETAVVIATGTYPIQAAATGTVVFRNFNTVPVEVPAGTRVAAGEVVFATAETVVAPAGSLTGSGTIAGGEVPVAVTAEIIGPGGNVGAEAIDTIVDQQTRNRLRGFPQNNARLVINPEPTAGGVDTTGIEFTQADVDTAVATLREALVAGVTEALEGTDEGLFADPTEAPEPVVTGVDGLAGARDQEAAEISGELAYDRLSVDPDDVRAEAENRLENDADAIPDGHELLANATEVTLGAVERNGDRLVVLATVTGRSAPILDRPEVIRLATGLTDDEARAALAGLGKAEVELWPGWVTVVPDSAERIEVEISGVEAPEPVPSGS